jgi:transcriptional regulator
VVRSQGKYFGANEVDKIVVLLRKTELTLSEIAIRMGCSRSAVAAINRRFQVRDYAGRRTQWVQLN